MGIVLLLDLNETLGLSHYDGQVAVSIFAHR